MFRSSHAISQATQIDDCNACRFRGADWLAALIARSSSVLQLIASIAIARRLSNKLELAFFLTVELLQYF